MKQSSNGIITLVGLSSLLLAGCATQSDIDSLRSDIQSLRQSTEEALAASQEARDLASNNSAELMSIQRDTASSLRLAQEANDKVDRAFEASVRK